MLRFIVLASVAVCVIGADEKNELTADGLEFMINQKDYQPPTFDVFGHTLVDTQGFPGASFLPLDNRGYSEIIEKCDFEKNSMLLHEYSEDGTVLYSPNTAVYDKYGGYDLVPENNKNYVPSTEYATSLNFEDYAKYRKEPIKMLMCRLPQDDGGAWHVQRIGPFVSTGGYDWWTVSWPDVGMFEEALKKYPEGIDVIREIFTPVLKDGTRLNYPPIHTHHVHALTRPGIRPRLNSRPMCLHNSGLGLPLLDNLVHESKCYNLSMFFEQHGDHICQPEDDGIDCLTQGDKNPRRLVAGLDVEGELNDVRPAGSEPMEWYYQIAMRWKPADPTEPVVSQISVIGPGLIDPASQLTKSFTAPTPTHAQSVMIYSAPFTVGGELRRAKIHAHSGIYEASMLLRGDFSDFGLADSKFLPTRAWQPLITTNLGFRDNDDLAQHILYHLGKSQEYYDQTCLDGEGQVKASALRNPVCRRPRPDWMCFGAVDSATVAFDGVPYIFDRRPKCHCKPYTFAAGERFTVVGFNKKVTMAPSPAAPGKIPPFMAQHIGFMISFVEQGRGHSSVDTQMSNHDGVFYHFHHKLTPPAMLARMVAVILYGGSLVGPATIPALEWFFTALFTALALYAGSWLVWGARKIPQVDHGVCVAWEVLLTFFTTHKPDWEALAARAKVFGDGRGQSAAYEMVPLTEDADGGMDMDLADEPGRGTAPAAATAGDGGSEHCEL